MKNNIKHTVSMAFGRQTFTYSNGRKTRIKQCVKEWRSPYGDREMGGKVVSTPACYSSSLGSNPDICQKYKMGDISKGVANTLYCSPPKYTKK